MIAEKLSEAEPVDEEALAVARWNLAVASIKSGDLASGRVILNELEEMKLNAAMNARVGAAIRFLEEKFLEDDAPLE